MSRLTYALRPWDPDGAIFVYMGRVVAEGGVFWRDVVDNKLPTVGFLTSLAWRGLGDWWLGYVLLQTVMAVGACLALGGAARRLAGARAWWPTVLFALVYLNLNTVVFGGFQLETIHVFFASLAALAAANLLGAGGDARRPTGAAATARSDRPLLGVMLDGLTVGLCAACAGLAKPTGLSVLAAAGVAALVYVRPMRRMLLAGAGATAGVALVAGVVLIYLRETGGLGYLPAVLDQIALYARNSATDVRDVNKIIWAAGVVGFPLLGRWWVGRRAAGGAGGAGGAGALLFLWVWLGLELLGVVLQKRMYGYHFLVLAPPAAVLFGVLRRPASGRGIAMALAPAMLLSLLGIGQVLVYSRGYQQRLESGTWLAAHAHPRDRVWRDMTSRLLIETDFRPGSRYVLTFLFCNSDDAPQRYWAEMRGDFDARRPRWMVLPRDVKLYLADTTAMVAELERLPGRRENYLRAWGELEAYIHANYRLAATLDRETVWERRDAGASTARVE